MDEIKDGLDPAEQSEQLPTNEQPIEPQEVPVTPPPVVEQPVAPTPQPEQTYQAPQQPQAQPQQTYQPQGGGSKFGAFGGQGIGELGPKPENNLTLAIGATVASLLTCCGYVSCLGLILGIVAIVFATQVDSKYKQGDLAGAESAAKTSKLLALIALGTVVVSIIVVIAMIAINGTDQFIESFKQGYEQGRGR